MNTPNYQGVILAAGHGSRMGPFGEQLPKPIAPICNKPLLAYQLEHMHALGIEDVIIVIGHLGHHISDTLGDGADYGVRIQYVEQKERLGLALNVPVVPLLHRRRRRAVVARDLGGVQGAPGHCDTA